ncbi:MAG: rod shape-determining protein MreD [Bacteroidota bacterium]
MNNSPYLRNIIRFVGFVLLQVLILKNIEIYPPYIHLLIYPLFIILMPFGMPIWGTLFLAFFLGISVDVFYDSLGLHAAASVLTAYARSKLLLLMEPRGGYDPNLFPGKNTMGLGWFIQFAAIVMGIHMLFYFFLEAFLFAEILTVILKSILSFFFSMILIVIHQYLAYPRPRKK